MASPFPGMNPYLEQRGIWHSFHEQFCTYCLEILVPQVRPGYVVKLDEQVYIHELSAEERAFLGRTDVSVAASRRLTGGQAAAAMEAPAYARLPAAVDIERSSYVEIIDRKNRTVVTAIELLSPANKNPGPDREQHDAKRLQIFASSVNLVEIDLLRGGQRLPLEDLPECDYYALVSRVPERPRVGVWPIGLRDPLPVIPVPLRPPDPDAHIDLQALVHRLYDAAGYEDYIYSGSPEPPLRPEDAAWAQRFIPTGA